MSIFNAEMLSTTASEPNLPSYQYLSLDHSIKETRLAELLPGSYDDDIQLKIHTVALDSSDSSVSKRPRFRVEDLQKDLPSDTWKVRETIYGRFIFEECRAYDDHEGYKTQWEHPVAGFEPITNDYNRIHTKPQYEALSHAWGPKEDQTLIYIEPLTSSISGRFLGRETLAVQSDLAVALRHLRTENGPRMLWIDNICINQEDPSERGHLVRHMGQIYRLAHRVIVWLGPKEGLSDHAMKTLKTLGQKVEITNKGSWRVNFPGCSDPEWSRTAVPLPYDAETWEAIRCLLRRPWFKRLWVWQEAKLSNDESVVQCGNEEMELYRFGAAVWCAAAKTDSTPKDLQKPLFRAGDTVLRQFDDPFLSTLLHLNERECSDPRDKIYGAFGLAPSLVSANVFPNYDAAVDEVYTNAAVALLTATDRVDFLLACNLATRTTIMGPTWAPDWSVVHKRSPRWLLSTTLASGVSISRAAIADSPRPTLLVQGVEVGKVCAECARAPESSDQQIELETVFRGWYADLPKQEMYANTKESLFDAFVKTVHWNTLRERCPLDSSLLSLEQARLTMRKVLHMLEDDTEGASDSRKVHYSEARGRSFVRLDSGYIGMTSAKPEEGDVVCVILGCPLPIILRSIASRYKVVGPTYIHGLMDAEALLGQLDPDIVVEVGVSSGWHGGSTFRNTGTNEILDVDPRLGKLPQGWVSIETVRKPTDPLHFCRYANFLNGEVINGDPRLLPDELRNKGATAVRLKALQLV